jgi:hypothetical protein
VNSRTPLRRADAEGDDDEPVVVSDAAARLSEDLKSMFDKVAEEPLPKHLLELADELERKRMEEALRVARRRSPLM